ncbi:thioredoxin [Bacillus cereus]|nr:thioredoxin [Bacillus cereus]
MKKMILFGSITTILFITIFLFTQITDKNKSEKNKTSNYYENAISLKELETNIEKKQNQTIYFYQTGCIHCKKISPIIVPMAKDMNINMKVINIKNEPKNNWDKYEITGTPTIIHFKNGKEVDRIYGAKTKEDFQKWFNKNKE